jgi:AhpD family alkylhydroperoxidase
MAEARARVDINGRVDVYGAWPPLYDALFDLTRAAYRSGLDRSLIHLIQIRASQLNGCAFCLDMHAQEALAAGEDQRRLNTIAAWRDTTWFTAAERAALALTEALVTINASGLSETIVDTAREQFGDEGLAKVLLAIAAITVWNQVNVAAEVRAGPGEA